MLAFANLSLISSSGYPNSGSRPSKAYRALVVPAEPEASARALMSASLLLSRAPSRARRSIHTRRRSISCFDNQRLRRSASTLSASVCGFQTAPRGCPGWWNQCSAGRLRGKSAFQCAVVWFRSGVSGSGRCRRRSSCTTLYQCMPRWDANRHGSRYTIALKHHCTTYPRHRPTSANRPRR